MASKNIKAQFRATDEREEVVYNEGESDGLFLQKSKKKATNEEEEFVPVQAQKKNIRDMKEIGKKGKAQFSRNQNWDTTINEDIETELEKKINAKETEDKEKKQKQQEELTKKNLTFADKMKQKRLEKEKFGTAIEADAEEFPDLGEDFVPKKKKEVKKKTEEKKENKPRFINSKNTAINNNKPLINILTDEDPNSLPKKKIIEDDPYDKIVKPEEEKNKIKFHDGVVQFKSNKQHNSNINKPLDIKDEQALKQLAAEERAAQKQKQLQEQLEKSKPEKSDFKKEKTTTTATTKEEENKEEGGEESKRKPIKFVNKKLQDKDLSTNLKTTKDGKTAKDLEDERQKFLAENEFKKQIQKKTKAQEQEQKNTNEFEMVLDKSIKQQIKKYQKDKPTTKKGQTKNFKDQAQTEKPTKISRNEAAEQKETQAQSKTTTENKGETKKTIKFIAWD